MEVGYFFFLAKPRIRAFVLGAGQKTHGGVDLPDAGWRAMPAYQQEHHDRIGRIDILDVGGGVQMALTRSVEVFGSFMTTVAGENAHALARGPSHGGGVVEFRTGCPVPHRFGREEGRQNRRPDRAPDDPVPLPEEVSRAGLPCRKKRISIPFRIPKTSNHAGAYLSTACGLSAAVVRRAAIVLIVVTLHSCGDDTSPTARVRRSLLSDARLSNMPNILGRRALPFGRRPPGFMQRITVPGH